MFETCWMALFGARRRHTYRAPDIKQRKVPLDPLLLDIFLIWPG